MFDCEASQRHRNLTQDDEKSDRLSTLAKLSEEDIEASLSVELENLDY